MKKDISLQLSDVTGKSWNFDDLKVFYTFAKGQIEYWEKAASKCPSPPDKYLLSYNIFRSVVSLIDSWKEELENWNSSELSQHVSNLKNNNLNNLPQLWLWSGHAFVGAYIECHKSYGQVAATSFCSYIVDKDLIKSRQKSGFIGSSLGYEYELQDPDLTKRRNSEKISFGHLRNQLEETTFKLTGEVEQFKDDFSKWDGEIRVDWNEWIEKSAEVHDHQQSNHKSEHDEQQATQKNEFISYMDGCKARIADLENTYQEKLRLEKPAGYWKKSAKKYGLQGSLWSLALIASILLGLVYFFDFFNSWLKGQELAVKLSTLQGAAIFGSILAVYAFLVKTISRLTFSSFHLMRDSEEREQLTYLYLSLSKGGQIDESSREIILQALFSRSETGLLSGESGPTMPVHDLLKTVLKSNK